jgi:hypothetical protein
MKSRARIVDLRRFVVTSRRKPAWSIPCSRTRPDGSLRREWRVANKNGGLTASVLQGSPAGSESGLYPFG